MNKGNIAIARNQGDAKGSLMRKSSSGGSENRSDDSGSCSIGNNSFGFNFDAEDMATEEAMMANEQEESADAQAADIAVAGLTSIATTYTKEAQTTAAAAAAANGSEPRQSSNLIMTLPNPGTVVSESSMTDCSDRPTKKAKKAVAINEDIREERNAREKERSFRISRQINEIRNLLSSGGVIVPKGTKSSVLTEAASYIRMLQQHQYRSEIDRHQLIQQMQTIGGGALGPEAASAIRHVAAQNGVWSLGNFGGVPPKSAMSYYQNNGSLQPNPTGSSGAPQQQQQQQPPAVDPAHLQVQTKIEDHECRLVFNSCSVGMAIASMGGALIDCNQLFTQLSNYNKQEVCSMTIFNLTSHQDLQQAFELISTMISPPVDDGSANQDIPRICVLRGAMKNRNDLGLSVALIKGDDNIAKCFCVTLIKNPASPFDTSKPVPATADLIQQAIISHKEETMISAPAYTAG